jgi:hypothetical protein
MEAAADPRPSFLYELTIHPAECLAHALAPGQVNHLVFEAAIWTAVRLGGRLEAFFDTPEGYRIYLGSPRPDNAPRAHRLLHRRIGSRARKLMARRWVGDRRDGGATVSKALESGPLMAGASMAS